MKALIYFYLLIHFSILNSFALEIDEKLTLRFLKVSQTKKTVLINRGAEDGLVVGNHAKFFTTSGVIARGVIEKVSPSRSVWSLYRIVDLNEITDDKVLNLKIGTPVKISEDASKSLVDEVTPSGKEKIIMSVPKENKLAVESDSFETDTEETVARAEETKSANQNTVKKGLLLIEPTTSGEKQWEVWGNASANMLSGNATNLNAGTVAASTPASSSTLDFSMGVEKYFFHASDLFNQLSFTGFFHRRTSSIGQDILSGETVTEFGGGLRYHFNQTAVLMNAIMPFALLDAGIGSLSLQSKVISGATTVDSTVQGSNTFFAVGGGAKYILGNGLGFKTIVDYYSSNESYLYATTTGTRTLSGLRIQAGLSYRFK
jgi:hypothetical protein